jgi:hypothetical protein
MLNARALELINGDIDGELGPQEKAELDAILVSSAEARTMKAELQRLANVLDGMPEQTPPAELADHILQQLKLPANRSSFSLAGLFASFSPAPMGLAFAAGLLMAVGFYEMSPGLGTPDDASSMVGTMIMDPPGLPVEQVAQLSISGPGVLGTVGASDVGNIVVLSFDLAAEQKTEIVIAMADSGLGFGGIAREPSSEPEVGEYYEVSEGSLRVVSETSRPFNVYLRRAEDGKGRQQGLGIEVIQLGERVFQGSLKLHGESG